MQVLRRSRKPVCAGDIFAYRVKDHDFGYGRVIRTGTRIGDFADVILIYIYRAFSHDKASIPRLSRRRLLLPPLGTNRRPWTMGYFETVAHAPLEPRDVLPVHCFKDSATIPISYRDEWGRKLARKTSPCGLYAIDSCFTIDVGISIAIGITPDSETLPP